MKGTAKAERAVKQKASSVKERTTEEQRRNAYYAAGGVALGLAALGGLYYYDRQGVFPPWLTIQEGLPKCQFVGSAQQAREEKKRKGYASRETMCIMQQPRRHVMQKTNVPRG
eukprot:1156645-Pelagomonas_calceolata.AAC.9